jgi:hypothetical protein
LTVSVALLRKSSRKHGISNAGINLKLKCQYLITKKKTIKPNVLNKSVATVSEKWTIRDNNAGDIQYSQHCR